MAERKDPMRDRELERRRENETKDLEVEARHGERPLEGLSSAGAGTTWTQEQDEREAPRVHGEDEQRSQEASRMQIPKHPGDPLPEG
jgi:hypothetical protein